MIDSLIFIYFRHDPDKTFEVFLEVARPVNSDEEVFILQKYPENYNDDVFILSSAHCRIV